MLKQDTQPCSQKGYIEITRSGAPGVQRQQLVGSHLVVGRNPQAQIILDHTTVSRSHAELVHDPFGRWWIHDLRSTNGTYVNGRELQTGQKYPLRAKDILALSKSCEFLVENWEARA